MFIKEEICPKAKNPKTLTYAQDKITRLALSSNKTYFLFLIDYFRDGLKQMCDATSPSLYSCDV